MRFDNARLRTLPPLSGLAAISVGLSRLPWALSPTSRWGGLPAWISAIDRPANRVVGIGRAQPARNRDVGRVAPLDDDSSKRSDAHQIRGWRAELSVVLYMAAHTAARLNSVIKACYQWLLARPPATPLAIDADIAGV